MAFTKQDVDRIIKVRCLPEEFRQDVIDIISMEDYEASIEELNLMVAQCYRFEPNHKRYDRNRLDFPKVEDSWAAPTTT